MALKDVKVVLIIGSHRTGTKSYAQFFDQYYSKEANSFHQYGKLRFLQVAGNLYLCNLLSKRLFSLIVRSVMLPHIKKHSDKEYYILSNGFAFAAADVLRAYFKRVVVIHSIRNPKSFAVSYLHFIGNRLKSIIANYFIPFWHLPGYFFTDYSFLSWKKLKRYEKMIWEWNFKNIWISNMFSTDDYHLLKLEDVADPIKRKKAVDALVGELKLPHKNYDLNFFSKKYNASHNVNSKFRNTSTKIDEKRINVICTEGLLRFGYETEIKSN